MAASSGLECQWVKFCTFAQLDLSGFDCLAGQLKHLVVRLSPKLLLEEKDRFGTPTSNGKFHEAADGVTLSAVHSHLGQNSAIGVCLEDLNLYLWLHHPFDPPKQLQ
jgi:hypothetical protein